jgi:hypothetical protein
MAVALLAACGPSTLDPQDPGGGPGDDDEFQDPPTCEQSVPIMLTSTEEPPDVLLVVDKSGSMAEPLDLSFQMKWDVMKGALRTLVEGHDLVIHFGLALYPTGDACAAGQVSVDIAPDNSGPIVGALDGIFLPDGATPTHTTLDAARTYFAGRPMNPNGRYVVVATDGEPNCGPAGEDDPTETQSVSAVTALAAAGIKTYVIGFGAGLGAANPQLLTDMAVAGGTTMYYQANSPADLAMALNDISGQVIVPSCSFTLTTEPENPDRLAVSFNGTPVPRSPSHATGWDYDAASNSITFYGASCDELQSGAVTEVHVDYGCGGPVVD